MEFDVPRHIGAMTREVTASERDGQPAHIVRAARSFDSSVEDVWDAVTNPERIPRWFSPVSGDLQLGGRYQVQGNAGGTIERCDPPRHLALTWESGGGKSWVELNLAPDADGRTRLELRHIAIIDDMYQGFFDQFGPGAVGVGWDLSFLGLAEHLESGWNKPPETDTEWTKTGNYKSFVAGSSDGWRQASVSLGTDEQAAAEAAERTRKFFSGEE